MLLKSFDTFFPYISDIKKGWAPIHSYTHFVLYCLPVVMVF